LPKHFLIPLHRTSLSEENKEFLRRKGVYTLPGRIACESLIEAYLLNVHPILPVIEADLLLSHHQTGQLERYNILLLWSLFFVAVNVGHQVSGSPFANLTSFTVYPSSHMRARRLHIEEGNEICDVFPSQGKKLFPRLDFSEYVN
jgi:hypothetical protein